MRLKGEKAHVFKFQIVDLFLQFASRNTVSNDEEKYFAFGTKQGGSFEQRIEIVD